MALSLCFAVKLLKKIVTASMQASPTTHSIECRQTQAIKYLIFELFFFCYSAHPTKETSWKYILGGHAVLVRLIWIYAFFFLSTVISFLLLYDRHILLCNIINVITSIFIHFIFKTFIHFLIYYRFYFIMLFYRLLLLLRLLQSPVFYCLVDNASLDRESKIIL